MGQNECKKLNTNYRKMFFISHVFIGIKLLGSDFIQIDRNIGILSYIYYRVCRGHRRKFSIRLLSVIKLAEFFVLMNNLCCIDSFHSLREKKSE